uniref:beta subunit of acetyl-CoA carboxylase carboxytransferase n=1 Tax=Kalinella pachyderma TaxID=2704665 RepID=UPI0024111C70|nr:beta subunit of acetyl-CoA carboxylase carboxytransferase [Kalinella pachyderma]WDY12901.1 beta subunit of acetyl-CoA carboxylase carboxytransferase [Kalinella pachyderma]
MSILAWIEDQKRLKVLNAPKYVALGSDSSKGLWTRCDKCGVILYIKHLKENQRVCFGCSYHLQMSSQERIESLLDRDSWNPLDETVSPCDPLLFYDQKAYTDRLQDAQEKTGLQDAIQTGTGMVDGIPVALGVMDFDFMGGSMGSVVGEKLTRLIEYATQEGLTLLIVCASGGARMQEGVFSLMQMAKVSSALQIYQSCAALLYISILTSPTTGGVTASFAMLGDIIFAEPKALIAFAGRRVIEQTLREDLPDDFQTSEYMLHHGLVDLIVPRRFLKQALSETIRLYQNAPFKRVGRIPFGVQNPISFLTEERIRRKWGTLTVSTTNSNVKTVLPNVQGLAWDGQSVKNFSFEANREIANQSFFFDNANISKEKSSAQSKDASVLPLLSCPSPLWLHGGYMGATPPITNKVATQPGQQVKAPSKRGAWHGQGHKPEHKYVPLPKKQLFDKMRQSMEYREILTSFEIVFNLFSREKYTSFNNMSFVDTAFTEPYALKARALAPSVHKLRSRLLSEKTIDNSRFLASTDTATKQSFGMKAYMPLLRIQGSLKKSKNNGGLQSFGVKKNIWNGLKCTKQSFARTLATPRINRKNKKHALNFLQSRASYLYNRFVPQKTLGQDTIFYVPLIHIAIKRSFVDKSTHGDWHFAATPPSAHNPRCQTSFVCGAMMATPSITSPLSGATSTQNSNISDRGTPRVKRAKQDGCGGVAPTSRALPLSEGHGQPYTVKANQFKLKNGKLPQPLLLHEWKSFSEKLGLHNYKQRSKQLQGFSGKAVSRTHNQKSNANIVYEPYKTKEQSEVPCACLHSISWSTNVAATPPDSTSTSIDDGFGELEPLQRTTVYAPITASLSRNKKLLYSDIKTKQSKFDSIKTKVPIENNGASGNKNTSVQGKALYAHQTNINFLNQAIELAATESVEWRAFYLHQRISKTTGFLEDFIQPALIANPVKRQLAVLHAKQEENVLFYRSICRSSFC